MRSAGFLSLGAAALFALPVAVAVAANAAAHEYAAQTRITNSDGSGVPGAKPSGSHSTVEPSDNGTPTDTPGGSPAEGTGGDGTASPSGNVSLTVPKVAFGADDSLPNTLVSGTAYTARVRVWVTPGIDGAQATLFNGDRACQSVAAPGGKVETLRCPVLVGAGDARSGASLRVEVRTAEGDLLRAVTYRHGFTRS